MEGEFTPPREHSGRRPYDPENCKAHVEQTDKLQAEVDKGSGRWTAMLWFLGVIGFVLSVGMTILISKTSDIQASLNKNDRDIVLHSEQIKNNIRDIDEIKTRNRYIDQQGNMKTLIDKERSQ